MKFTILGSTGFLGSHITNYLEEKNFECYTPDIRKENITKKHLGHVVYSIGSVDFNNPHKIVQAHTSILNDVLKNSNFDSFLYISTSRFYRNSKSTDEYGDIKINPTDGNQLYDLSKLLGESICISSNRKNVRIVRPSNIIGKNSPRSLFLPSIILDALSKGQISLHSSLESERDYLHVDDFVKIIPDISLKGKSQIYNIAHGKNITTQKIVDEILRITNCSLKIDTNSPIHHFPKINIKQIQNEFSFKSTSILDNFEKIIDHYKN